MASPFSSLSIRVRLAVSIIATLVLVAHAPAPAGADAVGDARGEAQRIAAELAELDGQLMDLNGEYEAANYALFQAEAAVAEVQRTSELAVAELEQRRRELSSFAVDAYLHGNDTTNLSVALTSNGWDAPRRLGYQRATVTERQGLIDAVRASQARADAEAIDLQQTQEQAASHQREIEQTRDEAQKAQRRQAELNQRAQGELGRLVAEQESARVASLAPASMAEGAAGGPTESPAGPVNASTGPTTSATVRTDTLSGSARPAPTPPAPTSAPVPAPTSKGASGAISSALSQVGKPYVWAAAGPDAYDCSGLILWAYARVGVALPHYSGAMYAMTRRVSRGELAPGDLVFWGAGGSEHVALYMGGNQLVHAYNRRDGVMVTSLDGWWKPPSGFGRL